MGTVYRKTATKPLPPDAETFTRKGNRVAKWKDRRGKTRSAPVTTGRDGSERVVIESGTYLAKYRDGEGIVREVSTGCRSKDAAMAVLKDLTDRAEKVKASIFTPAEAATADHQRTQLSDHFAAYLDHQTAKGLNKTRIANNRSRLNRFSDDCGLRCLADLTATVLERWLANRQAEGMSAGNRNEFRQALVGFCNWCVRTNRLTTNPLRMVAKADAKSDQRRKRRAMTENELRKLLDAARRRPLVDAMTVRRGKDAGEQKAKLRDATRQRLAKLGRERALTYKTYLLTGLRKNELATLTVGQLDLDGPTPCAVLDAADEKNRQGNAIALRSDLAADLAGWLGDKLKALQAESRKRGESLPLRLPAATLVFNVPAGLLRILNRDLAFAGIDKTDDRGRTIDVHALRHTFGTHLSKVGVSPRTAQAAMRHSTIDLTMNVYTDPRLLDVHGAIERLPALSLSGADDTEAATGTDGRAEIEPRKFAPGFAPTSRNSVQTVSTCDSGNKRGEPAPPRQETQKGLKTTCFPNLLQVEPKGVEPSTSALRTQRSPN